MDFETVSILVRLAWLAAASAFVLGLMRMNSPATAAQPQVGLGTATPFAVLAGSTVTNTGPSVISGSVGVSPGEAVVGFPPGLVNNGTIHAADRIASVCLAIISSSLVGAPPVL